MSDPGSTKLGLRDLVVGEPAMEDALDADAARRQAASFVNEAAADTRLAAAVEKVGGKVAPHEVSTVRLPPVAAPTAEVAITEMATLPPSRATAPRLAAPEPDDSPEGDLPGATTAEPAADVGSPRRLTRLAVVTLGVAVLLLAVVLLGRVPSGGGNAATSGEAGNPPGPGTAGLATSTYRGAATSIVAPPSAAAHPEEATPAPEIGSDATAMPPPTSTPSNRHPPDRARPRRPDGPGPGVPTPPSTTAPPPTTDRPF